MCVNACVHACMRVCGVCVHAHGHVRVVMHVCGVSSLYSFNFDATESEHVSKGGNLNFSTVV